MPPGLRKAGVLVTIVAFLAYGYAPLFAAGFLGDDFRTLVSVSELAREPGLDPGGLYAVEGTDARPAAALSLLVSSVLWSDGGRWTGSEAPLLRAENLILLFLAGWGLSLALRRALTPWTGPEPARSAGLASAVLFLLHPLCVSSVVRLDSRGDLLAAALGTWGLAAFLRGRQDSNLRFTATALACVALAAFSSKIALCLPLVYAGMEYTSARRHRPRTVRVRTAATTLVVFGLAVALEWSGRIAFAREGASEFLALDFSDDSWGLAAEKLGILLLPVNTFGIGNTGYVLAAIVIVFALHPGFVAARSAPRLWSRILLGWVAAIAAAELLEPSVRVLPGSLGNAQVLFPAVLVMSVGFGLSATAITGVRRTLLPASMCVLYSMLARANAAPLEFASNGTEDSVEMLRRDLARAAEARNFEAALLVLEPPSEVQGVDGLGRSLSHLLDPAFLVGDARAPRDEPVFVRGLTLDAFRAFAREPEFESLRSEVLTLVLPSSSIDREGSGWTSFDLPAPEPSAGPSFWRSEGNSPPGMVLETLTSRSLVVTARPDTDTSEPPVIRWTPTADVSNEEVVFGAWIQEDGEPVAVFDLERSLDWMLSDRARSVWFQGALMTIRDARVFGVPPTLPGEPKPRRVGGDWSFEVDASTLPEPIGADASWVLGLLDLETLTYQEVAAVEGAGTLRFPGVEGLVARAEEEVVWYLDRRVDGVTVARATGRRRAGSTRSGD